MVGFKGSAPNQDGGTMDEIRAILFLLLMFLTAMSPVLLLPLFLTDAQGRRWVRRRTCFYIFGIGFLGLLLALVTINWRVVAPYAETSFAGLHSLFNVVTQIPGDVVDWFESGEGLYFFLKALMTFAIIALFCARVLPILQKGLVSLKAQIKRSEASVEPRSVNREEIAASRERQQQQLQEKAREKDELTRQRRLAHATEQEQRLQRWGQGVGRYAR